MQVTMGSASVLAPSAGRSVEDAAATLERTAAALAGVADNVFSPFKWSGTRLAPPDLRPVDDEQAAHVTADLLDLFARRADGGWMNDHLCFPRAVLAAGHVDLALGGAVAGPTDTSFAGIAVAHMPRRRAGHHAAPIVQALDGSRWIIDWRMAPREGIIRLDAWQGILGVTPDQVSVQRTLDNAPLGMGRAVTRPTTAGVVRYARRAVIGSLVRHGNSSVADASVDG